LSDRTRLLLITPYFPPETGWGPQSFHELGCELARRGHEVVVLTGTPSYHVAGVERPGAGTSSMDGMTVVRLSTPNLTSSSVIGRGIAQLMTALKFSTRALGLGKFDASIVYSPPIFLPLVGALRCKVRRTPMIMNLQDLFPQSAIDLGLLRNRFVIGFLRWIERVTFRSSAMVTVHSPAHTRYVLENGGRKESIRVLWNWAKTDEIANGGSFLESQNLEGKFVVTFGGIVGFSQGTEVIVEAAQRLAAEPDFVFLIIGEGVGVEKLRRMATDAGIGNVRFLPMMPRESYLNALMASNVGLSTLSPSVTTPVVPSKIGTIMASGIPVVAALNAGSDGIALIKDADCGIVVQAGNAEALANALLKLKSDPDLCARYGKNGRRYAVENLSISRAAKTVEEMVEQVRASVSRP
jgi:colanic acid biosynthesis glycosyl transferase WcaI